MSKKFILSEWQIRQAIVDYVALLHHYYEDKFNVSLKYDDTQINGEKFQAVVIKRENT